MKLNIIYNIITCNPEPQLKQTVLSDVWFTNESFFWTDSFESLFWIGLKRLNQFAARAAQT